MTVTLQAALEYAAAGGWRVLPLDGKVPRVPEWPKRASCDAAVIRAWWSLWPDANIGLLCGNGLLVLDVDGDGARRELARLEALHCQLPATPAVATGRDGYGRHLYFAAPRGARSWHPARGLEVRARGCQVVAPPSVHPDSGREYVWLDRPALARAPEWLLRRPPPKCSQVSVGLVADGLQRVPADVYVPLLTGRAPNQAGYISCPLHHGDNDPSLKVYADGRGWFCYGCHRGGTIIDLAAGLWGLGTRGDDYLEVRRRLAAVLAREVATRQSTQARPR
jgi:hypothetical protein